MNKLTAMKTKLFVQRRQQIKCEEKKISIKKK
jgi:hypothetical protein